MIILQASECIVFRQLNVSENHYWLRIPRKAYIIAFIEHAEWFQITQLVKQNRKKSSQINTAVAYVKMMVSNRLSIVELFSNDRDILTLDVIYADVLCSQIYSLCKRV